MRRERMRGERRHEASRDPRRGRRFRLRQAAWTRCRGALSSLLWLSVAVSLVALTGVLQEGPPAAIYGQSWSYHLYQPLLSKMSQAPLGPATDTATVTPTGTATDTATVTPTGTATDTATITPTGTATDTATVTPTGPASDTATITPTGTATMTATPTTATATMAPPLNGFSGIPSRPGNYRPDPVEALSAMVRLIVLSVEKK